MEVLKNPRTQLFSKGASASCKLCDQQAIPYWQDSFLEAADHFKTSKREVELAALMNLGFMGSSTEPQKLA